MSSPNRIPLIPVASGAALPWISALLSGTLFGLGLAISEMVNPAKVLAFLDVTGNWDPTLAFVMLGALVVATPAFHFSYKRGHPWFAASFPPPAKTDVQRPLVLGAALFGIGWGLAGLCPGPALTAVVTGEGNVLLFVGAMLGGAFIHDRLAARPRRQ